MPDPAAERTATPCPHRLWPARTRLGPDVAPASPRRRHAAFTGSSPEW